MSAYKVGFTSVVGDLLHAGHLIMLRDCKEKCDYLVVGLICDPTDRPWKNKPIESVYERFVRLSSCKYVDEVVPLENEKDLELFLLADRRICVRFVGEDYLGKDFTGKEICSSNGVPIEYTKREHGISTTEIRRKIRNEKIQIRDSEL